MAEHAIGFRHMSLVPTLYWLLLLLVDAMYALTISSSKLCYILSLGDNLKSFNLTTIVIFFIIVSVVSDSHVFICIYAVCIYCLE